MIHYKHQTITLHTIEVNNMFHPSELKAMKAAKNNRIKFSYNTETNVINFAPNSKGQGRPSGQRIRRSLSRWKD